MKPVYHNQLPAMRGYLPIKKRVLRGEVYKATYALVNYDGHTRCAWCNLTQLLIEQEQDINEHIERHVKTEKEALDTAFKEWSAGVRMRKRRIFKPERDTTRCSCIYIATRKGECFACMQEDMYQRQIGRNKAVDELNKKLQELGE